MSVLTDIKRVFVKDVPNGIQVRTNPENPATSLSNPAAWLMNWFGGGRTRSGRTVTIESALSLTPINAAVRLITETMASLKLDIEAPEGHYLHKLFENPSPFYTRFSLFEAVQYHTLTSGNGFARLIRQGSSPQIKEIRLIEAKDVIECIPNFKEGTIFYKIRNHDGSTEMITQADVFHLPFFAADGIWGRSPISMMKDTIALMLTSLDYITETYQKGGKLEGVVMTPMGYTPTAKENIQNSWNDGKRGVKVLEEGLKFMPVSMKPEDMAFKDMWIQLVREASRIYRVPAAFLEEDSQSTFSNFEQKGTTLQMYVIRPWVKRWEHELNRKLVLPSERGKVRFRFNMNSLSRGDAQARAELYRSMQQGFAIMPDEMREMEGLERYPDNTGQVAVGPMNFTELKNLKNNVVQNGNQ